MTLLEPLRMSVSINRRYESFAVAVFPRIQVSIGGILNELGSRTSENKTVTRMTRIEERFGFMDYQFVERVVKQNTNHEVVTHDRRELVGRMNLIRVNPRFDQRVTQSPVLRVFARFHERDPGVMLRKLLFENESQRVIERVSRDHTRVEQRTRGEMVIKTQTKPSAVTQDRQKELETQFASTPTTRSPSWPEKPPEINVEQLTEQVIRRIDHRITAYRERLGRAF